MEPVSNPRSRLGSLEYREGDRILSGHFPYGKYCLYLDKETGKVQRETFNSNSLGRRIDDPAKEIYILYAHDENKPLANRLGGTLDIRNSAEGVDFVAQLPPTAKQPTWMRDAVLGVQGGTVRGLSPGFRVVQPRGETRKPDPVHPMNQVRVILDAEMPEMSLLPVAAYKETVLDLRADELEMIGETEERIFGLGKNKADALQAQSWAMAAMNDQAYIRRKMIEQMEMDEAGWSRRGGMQDRLEEAAGHAEDEDMEYRKLGQTARTIMDLLGMVSTGASVADAAMNPDRRAGLTAVERRALAWL